MSIKLEWTVSLRLSAFTAAPASQCFLPWTSLHNKTPTGIQRVVQRPATVATVHQRLGTKEEIFETS